MAVRRAWFFLFALVACGEDAASSTPPAAPADDCAVSGTCATPLAEPPANCPAGEAPLPGRATCTPVGPTACAQGFERASDGWACLAILPSQPCTGATRDALGERACVPVGDCASVFPPNDATVFVDGAPGPMHFAKIQEALDAAPPGAVIAIADGTYEEALSVTKAAKLVGRCAAKVTIVNPTAEALLANSAPLDLRAVTLEGGKGAVASAPLRLEDVVVTGAFDHAIYTKVQTAPVTLLRSVVRGVRPNKETYGQALVGVGGATIDLEESVVEDVVGRGGVIFDTGHIKLHRSVVRAMAVTPDWKFGNAFAAYAGGTLLIDESALVDTQRFCLAVAAGPSKASVTRSTIANVGPDDTAPGIAVVVSDQGSIDFLDSSIDHVRGVAISLAGEDVRAAVKRTAITHSSAGSARGYGSGLTVQVRAQMTFDDSVIFDSTNVSVIAAAGTLKVARSYIAHTTTDRYGAGGYAFGVSGGSDITIEGSTIEDSHEIAVIAEDRITRLSLTKSLVRGIGPNAEGKYGFGVAAFGDSRIDLDETIVTGAHVGAVVASDAQVRFRSGAVRSCPIGVHAQDGSTVREGDPARAPDANDMVVSENVVFDKVGTRVGGSEVVVPSPVLR